ncbi:MAG: FprA family A-type flavoprotein [Dehalococcoidales bacterium]|nr:FprA family A-type flavoprotein [Dehalococcoidales bacterium]
METRTIRPGIFSVGVMDWDRRLFDSLIPLPDGTSYNSYLVKGSEKTALLDAVDPPMEGGLLRHLQELDVQNIDYIVAHHGEQDHSGGIPAVLAQYPMAKVVANPRCKGMLVDLLHIPESQFIEVKDGETISLGNYSLKFIYTPWVHWPETMVTYLKEEKILFSCDFFGSHIAASDLYVTDEGRVHEAAKRYFAEIMMPFRVNIQKDLEKLQGLPLDIIAPSHGPMYNKPDFIMRLYHSWVYDEPKNIVVIAFTSMHGSTQQMVDHLVEELAGRGIEVKQFNMPVTDIGKLAMALVEAATIILGTPTVLAGPHPNVATAAFLANALRPGLKYAGIIGSYLWGGKTVEVLKGLIPNLNVELFDPVMVKGLPREADFASLDKLADAIAEKHRTLLLPSS